MSRLWCWLAAGLCALCVQACGIAAKPVAGSARASAAPGNHARIDDPRRTHVRCLRSDGYTVREYRASGNRYAIQVGQLPKGPTIIFDATDGAAQYAQISGQEQAAEVIGTALLYPNGASDGVLNQVEHCVALGVTG